MFQFYKQENCMGVEWLWSGIVIRFNPFQIQFYNWDGSS